MFEFVNLSLIVIFLILESVAVGLNLFPELKVFEFLVFEVLIERFDGGKLADENGVGFLEVLDLIHVALEPICQQVDLVLINKELIL